MNILRKGSWLDLKKIRPFSVLVRHFFQRLFQNDFVAFEDQMKEKTISILAMIAIFSTHVANSVLMKYMFDPDEGLSWVEKCYFTSFIMLLLGFVTVFEWDILFPDSRDYANLLVLPIPLRTIFAAKFASLFCFVVLFAFGTNILSVLPFWFHLPKWQTEWSFLFSLYFVLVHLICMFAASFFVFFFAVFLIGLLMLVLPKSLFRSLSLILRTLLMIVFILALVSVVSDSLSAGQPFQFLTGLKSTHSPLFYLFPPMWFTGLYEVLLGNGDSQFRTSSFLALMSLVFVTAGFFAASALGYRKICRETNITGQKKVKKRLRRFFVFFRRVFDAAVLGNPIERGIFYFFGKTLKHSMVHKMRLAAFVAVGFAFSLILLAVHARPPFSFSEPNRTLLTLPLILTFFLVLGLRSVVNIPYRLEANWIFRITEERRLQSYAAGLRKGIIFFFLFPFAVLVAFFSSLFWGWTEGLFHGIFGFVVSVLLMEILFLKFNKIPFACAYLPGQARVHLLWPVYVVSFLVYILLPVVVEKNLLSKPLFFLLFLCLSFAGLVALRMYQNYRFYRRMTLVYIEEPEPALMTLLTFKQN